MSSATSPGKRFLSFIAALVPLVSLVVAAPAAGAVEGRGPANAAAREEVARPVGGGPVPGAPQYALVEGAQAGEFTAQGAYLPFNFTFNFAYSLNSRTFWPSTAGKACVNLRGTGSSYPGYYGHEIRVEMWNSYGTDTRVGATVRYAMNGSYHGYCWTGLYPYHEHYFRLVKDWGGGSAVWGDGWVSAS